MELFLAIICRIVYGGLDAMDGENVKEIDQPQQYQTVNLDVPLTEETKNWTRIDKILHKQGKKFFFRKVGLLSQAQLEQPKY